MKLTLYLVLFTFIYNATSDSSVYNNIKEDVLSFLKRSYDDRKPRFEIESNNNDIHEENTPKPKQNLYMKAMKLKAKSKQAYEAKEKTRKEHEAREKAKREYEARIDDTKNIGKQHYQLDPVLNFLRRTDFRRRRKHSSSSSEGSSSSSMEMKDWKEEWKEHWIHKKFEAINSTEPRGDVVNMIAARPWGVPCGDPNQHDMPWGTCMLPMECESEYRIYRGDYFCGRTQFVCCSLQLTNYDMYQGFDVSFDDSGLSTDSEEKRNRGKGSKEKRKRKKAREKKRRKKDRLRRKRKIKKNIKKIIREIRKILNRAYRNGTSARKKKTKQLKKFVKELKKKYKKDRKSVKAVHEIELIRIDGILQKKLNQIRDVNQNFMKNGTFRDIIVNGTTDKQGARMLIQAYPDLAAYFADKTRRSDNTRRTGNKKEHLDYDVEYGMLYY